MIRADRSQTGDLLINEQHHEPKNTITDLQWAADRTYFLTASKDKTAKVTWFGRTSTYADWRF